FLALLILVTIFCMIAIFSVALLAYITIVVYFFPKRLHHSDLKDATILLPPLRWLPRVRLLQQK
ncbi:MAG TPA: hypothetical protein PLW99_02870, partial [Candidatus Paceibacterota bacterium]|nr:hypothetical protein [Candidatus Paceibacterota bacterium]